jgi:homoprotocatechuate degradation regulator HpaR
MAKKQQDVLPARAVPRDFATSLPMVLLRAREATMRQFHPTLRAHDLTGPQWRVLRALWLGGDMEMLALARATFLQAPSLSRIIPNLESRGLCVRRASQLDRRRSVIGLTRSGLSLLRSIEPQTQATYAEITRRFGGKRLEQLIALALELEQTLVSTGSGGGSDD